MSIFGSILSKIFPSQHPAVAANPASVGTAASSNTAAVPNAGPAPATATQSATGGASSAATPSSSAQGSAAPPQVVVEQVLNGLAEKRGEKLNWRTSIVDLMKLLDLDSSLAARKQLAQELHYAGDMNDSAAMNIWLQKQVMQKLADNGGKVPADLKS